MEGVRMRKRYKKQIRELIGTPTKKSSRKCREGFYDNAFEYQVREQFIDSTAGNDKYIESFHYPEKNHKAI